MPTFTPTFSLDDHNWTQIRPAEYSMSPRTQSTRDNHNSLGGRFSNRGLRHCHWQTSVLRGFADLYCENRRACRSVPFNTDPWSRVRDHFGDQKRSLDVSVLKKQGRLLARSCRAFRDEDGTYIAPSANALICAYNTPRIGVPQAPIFVGEVITCYPADMTPRSPGWVPGHRHSSPPGERPQLPRGIGEGPRPIAPSHGENRG